MISDREIIFRSRGRISHVRVPAYAQIAVAVALFAGATWLVHTSYAYVAHHEIVAAKSAVIDERDEVVSALRTELARVRRQFGEVTDSLEENRKDLVSLIGQNRALEGNIEELRAELGEIESERNTAAAARAGLKQQLAAMEVELHRAQARNHSLSAQLEKTGEQLAEAMSDNSRANRRGLALSERASELQNRLAGLHESQTALLDRLSGTAQSEVDRLQFLLASAGLNVDRILKRQGVENTAQGGPFEPAGTASPESKIPDVEVALTDANSLLDRLEGLQRVVRALPLSAPLDYYYISSPYGKREDPINGESAIHRGLDFGSKQQATVFSTAPGMVTFAGWNGHFGRFVEIDHGNGIVTRYGHLRRIYVKRGQKIDFRVKIGQMGSSGRSTGTHLHYEIHVNGASVDPMKFLKAGKNVFKG